MSTVPPHSGGLSTLTEKNSGSGLYSYYCDVCICIKTMVMLIRPVRMSEHGGDSESHNLLLSF